MAGPPGGHRERPERAPVVACTAAGRPVADTTDVDHIVSHRGNPKLFWWRQNLQGLCHGCHSRKTQRGE
ncbi:MAG: HNH endonuclease [Acidobacteria bacterium]|nr:HNH endonuclease [Acidobacteriota bacterium]